MSFDQRLYTVHVHVDTLAATYMYTFTVLLLVYLYCVGPSTSPVNITITSSSVSSVIISWLPPDIPNGIITQYTLYVTLIDCPDSTTESLEPVVTDGMDYEITGMSPYQQIRVQVSGSTAIGEGPMSAMMLGRGGEEGI